MIGTRVKVGAALCVFVGAAVVVSPLNPLDAQAQPVRAQHMTEDSRGWNCRTMGNHRCGNPLPRWAHWQYASKDARADCGGSGFSS